MFGISACLKERAMNSDVPVRRAVIRGYAIPMPGTRYPAPCTRYAARCPELTAGARSAGGVGRWERVRVRRAADGS